MFTYPFEVSYIGALSDYPTKGKDFWEHREDKYCSKPTVLAYKYYWLINFYSQVRIRSKWLSKT